MIIIISQSDDILSKNIYNLVKKKNSDINFIDESIFFSEVQFSIQREKKKITGFIIINGKRIPLNKIEGIFLRLGRLWWPSTDLHLQDQIFIYHETIASWFSILQTLNCPVINRFPLGWWLQETTTFDILKLDTANRLKLNLDNAEFYKQTGKEEIISFYIAGRTLFSNFRKENGISKILSKNFSEVVKWLEQKGIYFCRLDFKNNGVFKLHNIDIAPVVDNEPEIIIKKISKAIAGRLS